MTNRRNLLKTCMAAGAASVPLLLERTHSAVAQQAPKDFYSEFVSGDDEVKSGVAVGAAPSRHDEIAKAIRLMFGAPRGPKHMEAVQYFADIKDMNSDKELYNAEWKVRSNPLIVGFFSMTNTKPAVLAGGDQTYWCAAFVNFILLSTGHKGTWSAMSGSFRNGPYPSTKNPKVGDLVVMQNAGPDGLKGSGHVSFFLDYDSSSGKLQLLGGNQRGNTGTDGAVCVSEYNAKGKSQFLHSFRSVT